MRAWRSLLVRVGLAEGDAPLDEYQTMMRAALNRLRLAEVQLREAHSLEQLDLGRTAMQQALAEVQHLVRQAKADRGIPLRSIADTEAMYQRLLAHLKEKKPVRPNGSGPSPGPKNHPRAG